MTEAVFAIPGDLKSATGGYAYDRRLIELLPDFGIAIRHLALPATFPNPTKSDLAETARLVAASPAQAVLLIDGMAYGAFAPDLLDCGGRRVIAVVHHPLFLETGLTHARKVELRQSERDALQRASHIIVTSRATAQILSTELSTDAHKVTVAEPGTEPAMRATGTGVPLQILAVGAVSPRKNYGLLIDALAALKELDWKLTIAGALDRNVAAVEALRDKILSAGLDDRVSLAGKVVPATLDRLYNDADLFVSSSLFEGYGMVLAEAMARGLPIVTTTGGAAGDTARQPAALHVENATVGDMTAALRRTLTEKRLRNRLADAAWDAGRALPTWHETARRVAAVVHGLQL